MSSDAVAGATAPGPEEGSAGAGSVVAIASLAELVKLRDARGFSASLVSSRLRLAPRQIAALETGDWASLPGRTFIRSSLRSYGRLLEVDVAPLLQAIESDLPGTDVLKPDSELNRPMPREGALGFGGNGSGSRWVWMLLLVGGVIALAFFYGGGATLLNRNLKAPASEATSTAPSGERLSQPTEAGAGASPAGSAARPDASPQVGGPVAQQGTRPTAGAGAPAGAGALTGGAIASPANSPVTLPGAPPSTATAAAAAPPTSTPASATASSTMPSLSLQATSQQPANPQSASSAQSVAAPAAPVAAQGAASASTPATPPPWPASVVVPRAAGASGGAGVPLNPLVMRFPADSWIEVRDASGAILVTGTQPPGTVRELSGELPLSLIIGNAGGVAVTWRGVPIDLAPHMRQGIARFRIE
jgi:cytoskeleton protein RodZ